MGLIQGFNPEFFTNPDNSKKNSIEVSSDIIEDPPKKKRGRPPKNRPGQVNEVSAVELSMDQSNVPYYDTFNETNGLIKGAIYQLDMLNNDVTEQINTVKNSKTIKNKYNYLSNLAEVSSGLISSKINAVKELNNVIKTCHDLELKRTKELKLTENDKNDDQRLMEMYNAFITTPVGQQYPTSFSPSAMDMMAMNNSPNINLATNPYTREQAVQDQFMNNLSPEMNRMIQSDNPNIKTVVVYDQSTGQRWFDNIDITTGTQVPNMPIPDSSFLDDTNINLKTMTARNSNINRDYPLVVVGQQDMSGF